MHIVECVRVGGSAYRMNRNFTAHTPIKGNVVGEGTELGGAVEGRVNFPSAPP